MGEPLRNMYERYWKLNRKPFANELEGDFYFASAEHKECLVRMIYAVNENKSLVVLTGPSGSGKTFLLNQLHNKLISQRYPVSLVTNPIGCAGVEVLGQVLDGFRFQGQAKNKREMLKAFQSLAREAKTRKKRLVVLLDEADTLQPEAFEELRLLMNLQDNGSHAVTIVLAGSPRLRDLLAANPTLAQRVDIHAAIQPMDEGDSLGYIQHRVEASKGPRSLFDQAAQKEVFYAARGIPRMINNICDLSLLIGCGEGKKSVDVSLVRQAKDEFREHALPYIKPAHS